MNSFPSLLRHVIEVVVKRYTKTSKVENAILSPPLKVVFFSKLKKTKPNIKTLNIPSELCIIINAF